MALVPVNTRNRIDPIPVSNIPRLTVPYATYDQVEMCQDPNCSVCREQGHHKRRHHRHHRKHHRGFWDSLLPRVESASSAITVHSIELDERHPYYNSYVNERAIVPVNQAEQQIVTRTTRPQRIAEDNVVREAWVCINLIVLFLIETFQIKVNNPTNDDEVVCCRAYDGCRCPCWCCIILIILFVILIIVLIVLLATLL